MKLLSKLSPAESLLVLKGNYATLKQLLKITFMDLILKQVIRTFDVTKQATRHEGPRVYKYVEAGKNFSTYQPTPHENVFLIPFQKNPDTQILFRHIVKMGYQNSKSENAYRNILKKSTNIQYCFSTNMIQMLFGDFSITREGLELRNKLQSEITELEKTLPNYINNNPQKVLDILKDIKGNVFHLTNIEFETLKQIDKDLMSEMNRYDKDYRGGVSCSGTWGGFDHYSDSFDSSCGGTGGNWSACSGCAGGSGCSGCGGCGGCGG